MSYEELKKQAARMLGRAGGLKGGKAKSEAKRKATRLNLIKAREIARKKRLDETK